MASVLLAIDPRDGSSNISNNVSIGTIFSKMSNTIQIYVIQENGKMIVHHTTNVKIPKR